MALLRDFTWKTTYTSDDRALVEDFYVPALDCAVRYHRATGFFSARALTLAARGVEGLLRNDGRMRLLVGCTLKVDEVQAIARGESLRDTIEGRLLRMPLIAANAEQQEALELVSWMIAKGYLEVRIAIPCDLARRPCPANEGIFHDKSGVIEDKTGDRIAFTGSVNETPFGWGSQEMGGNWERLTVFSDFGEGNAYVNDVEQSLSMLWENRAKHALVIDIPTAVQKDLLRFLPENDEPPHRLKPTGAPTAVDRESMSKRPDSDVPAPAPPPVDLQRLCWGVIRYGTKLVGGERVGEATSIVTPWPHQVRTYERLFEKWPPKMLIADEVGLGKTITAGLLLRQAWLSGLAKRVLILAPKAVLRQWQVELREKLNLNWPVYDGHNLSWYKTPALHGRTEEKVDRDAWHEQPFVITSSQLMRRADRAREVLAAEPWDLVVLDEAHHARRKGVGGLKERGPNQLLNLMHGLRPRTQGLLLLTATPMQVHPVEVWDLLHLLGLPQGWDERAFLDFFDRASAGNPSHEDFEWLASRFREVEALFGDTPREMASRCLGTGGKLSAIKILAALRDEAQTPRRQLSTERRRAALKLMRANTPVARLVARHTRELLRRYFKDGKIETPIPERDVVDRFVEMSPAERDLYDMVEDYISSTYDQASGAERNAVGFVMTIYRRRLASSFKALSRTLHDRLLALSAKEGVVGNDEDVLDEDYADEAMDVDEAEELEKTALRVEEGSEIEHILGVVKNLPTDTKARELLTQLSDLRADGYDQVMVFTQYTATMDFLREELFKQGISRVLCFSGRGGELPARDGSWRKVSRDEVKRIFREKGADIMLCTDAAAEGLNFQFCGALVNYDLPWNPMKVEQRIGRIDRLGQKFEHIRIVNLHYENTVETDVYRALQERIGLFTKFVGKLQPILASLPRSIAEATLTSKSAKEESRAALISNLQADVDKIDQSGFDLDEIVASDLEEVRRPQALYNLDDLDCLLRTPAALPPGIEVKPLARGEYQYSMPGMKDSIRVTTSPEYFDDHPESTELWSPGSPLFPSPEIVSTEEEAREAGSLRAVLSRGGAKTL